MDIEKNDIEKIDNLSSRYIALAVKLWSANIEFFLDVKILRSFDLVNKNRLRNIFKRYIKDEYLWIEIEKMLNCGFISISNDFIYNSKECLSDSLLSSFLFNLYMHEFDSFAQSLIYKFNLIKDFYFNKDKINRSLSFYQNILKKFSPIRLENNLNYSLNLKEIISFKCKALLNNFIINSPSIQVYKKTINYVRYLDSVLFGCISSRSFVSFLQKKVNFFLGSQLHFGIKRINVFDFKESNIIFLGFNIQFFKYKRSYSFDGSHINKKYFSKILFRLVKYQKKISQLSFERFNSEFFINLEDIFNKNGISKSFTKKRFFWNYVFQLEAVRSTRLNKLVLTSDRQFMVPCEIFAFVKNISANEYQKYSFDLYNLRMQIVLRDVLKSFPSPLGNSVLSIDLTLSQYLSEFKKKIVLLYNEYRFETPLSENKLLSKKFLKLMVSSNLGYINAESISYYLRYNFFNINAKRFNRLISFYVPSGILISKLRSLGYIHPHKNRPIGNSKLLYLEDSLIIKSFGYMAYSILFWYNLCENTDSLRFIAELLRESCFLTLCRKHNKSKNWAYITYTPDLVISQSLFDIKSFFPTRKFILNFTKEKISYYNFRFDEKFFLEL